MSGKFVAAILSFLILVQCRSVQNDMTSDCPNGLKYIRDIGNKIEITKHKAYNFLYSETNPSKDLKGREKAEFMFKLDDYNTSDDKCVKMEDVLTYIGIPSHTSKLKNSELFFYQFNTERYPDCFDDSWMDPLYPSEVLAFKNCSLVTFYFSKDKKLFKIDSGFFY